MRKPLLTIIGGVVGMLLSLGVAAAADEGEAKTSDPDKHFLMEAAQGGLAEVHLGQLAAQRATSAEVKQFGQRMVDDHGKANKELMQLADSEGVTLPKEMDSKAKETADRLSKLSGAEFDRAYMKEMVEDHTKDVSAFQRQAEQGKDQDVKGWAAKTLPTLQEHLQMAKTTAAKVGATQESMRRE